MLFKFGKFWKGLLFMIGTWVFYGCFGFDMTVITLLGLIMVQTFKSDSILL